MMKTKLLKCVAAVALVGACLPGVASARGYTETKYPIMLVHGLFGFDKIGPVEYFYGVRSALTSGGATVYLAQVSAANSTEVRGEALYWEVKRNLALTGASKMNLIGHSHGSPTSRYVARHWPEMVASVTSVGGVNKGSVIADVLVKVAPDSVIKVIGNGLASLINWLSGGKGLPQNGLAAANSLSTAGSLKFNTTAPQGVPTTACGEGAYTATIKGKSGISSVVSYYSWSGAGGITNVLDVTDPFIGLLSLAFLGAKNDGLVSSCSSHLGKVIRDDYKMNHLDEVNQTVGIVHLFETNPKTVYRAHANRLLNAGL